MLWYLSGRCGAYGKRLTPPDYGLNAPRSDVIVPHGHIPEELPHLSQVYPQSGSLVSGWRPTLPTRRQIEGAVTALRKAHEHYGYKRPLHDDYAERIVWAVLLSAILDAEDKSEANAP